MQIKRIYYFLIHLLIHDLITTLKLIMDTFYNMMLLRTNWDLASIIFISR